VRIFFGTIDDASYGCWRVCKTKEKAVKMVEDITFDKEHFNGKATIKREIANQIANRILENEEFEESEEEKQINKN
jgi:hypothetical protein